MNSINRKLTGNWYLKKTLFGYKVMVEITFNNECSYDLSISPEITKYVKAELEDLLILNIKVL